METIVMSVGGSLIVPSTIDTNFLRDFVALVYNEIKNDRQFIIITGGGRTARGYQEAANDVAYIDAEDLDWLGIHATRLNGHLLRTLFKDVSYPIMITNPDEISDAPKTAKVIIAAGYRPGASTDLRAIQIAERVGATKVINLSNTDYIYSSNPKTNPDARMFTEIAWSDFRKLIPEKWDPGLSSPFDPVAAREAERLGIEVAYINGTKLEELTKYLNGKMFIGTRIH